MTRAVPNFGDKGPKGSQKWMIRAVNDCPDALGEALARVWPDLRGLDWRSPLRADDCAEYRDGAFLERLGLDSHRDTLTAFWPRFGPQWDALAVFEGGVLLVEAKAHVAEAVSGPSGAGPESRGRIDAALREAAEALGATPKGDWNGPFYQYANRLAHLHFLRDRCGVDARLAFVDFVGDAEMGGPDTEAEWRAVTTVIETALGLPARARWRAAVGHVHLPVSALG